MTRKTWIIKMLSLIIAIATFLSVISPIYATEYDEGCVELPEDVEYVEDTIDYDETYDGFYDDYYDDYGFVDGNGNFVISVPTTYPGDPLELANA